MVSVPLDLMNVLLAAVLPMLTALVTARFANSSVKTLVLVLLTVIATAVQAIIQQDGTFEWRPFLMTATLQFLMSVGLHFGLLKPTGVTGAGGLVAQKVPAGIGGPSERPGNLAD